MSLNCLRCRKPNRRSKSAHSPRARTWIGAAARRMRRKRSASPHSRIPGPAEQDEKVLTLESFLDGVDFEDRSACDSSKSTTAQLSPITPDNARLGSPETRRSFSQLSSPGSRYSSRSWLSSRGDNARLGSPETRRSFSQLSSPGSRGTQHSSRSWLSSRGRSFDAAPRSFPAWVRSMSSSSTAAVNFDDMKPVDGTGKVIERGDAGTWFKKQSRRGSVDPLRIPEAAVIGEGQYGVIWRGWCCNTKKEYAVKTMKTGFKDQSLASRELEIAEYVREDPHPCLVQLLGVFQSGTEHCALVMEYCPGGDLQSRIKHGRQIARSEQRAFEPPAEAIFWIAQIFLGLEHVHLQIELLFRDLKPANVVFTSDGLAKITDFGLSRYGIESAGTWSFGFPTGTPGYTAPEISDQEKYDHRADLYSLGVLIWVLLTGGITDRVDPAPPVSVVEEEWCLFAQCLDEPSTHDAETLCEPALDLVKKLTAREPSDRLQHNGIREHVLFEPQDLPSPLGPNKTAIVTGSSGSSFANSIAKQNVLHWLQSRNSQQLSRRPSVI